MMLNKNYFEYCDTNEAQLENLSAVITEMSKYAVYTVRFDRSNTLHLKSVQNDIECDHVLRMHTIEFNTAQNSVQ